MKARNFSPTEIRIEILKAGVTQAHIARQAGVSDQMIYHVIQGTSVSDRVRRAIAKVIGKDVAIIWPETYLYGGGPRKPGRQAN
ncbi:MAG: helix-turn-helix domain-containing protein [Spirochaetes bacterium]|nr:helix-turn-helix domain-containing protein [Spirochaetota bacterium]